MIYAWQLLSLLWQHIKLHIRYPDTKVYGANMGPIWGRQDQGGPHVGTMNIAIWELQITPYFSEFD